MMCAMNRNRSVLMLCVIVAFVAAGCGSSKTAGKGSNSTAASDTAATTTTAATQPVVDVKFLGETTRIGAGANGAVPMAAAPSGRECGMSKDLFGSCRAGTGAGGVFTVTFENDKTDFTWDVVVRCGVAPAVPIASAPALKLTVSADLKFDSVGEVVGVLMNATDGSEAALVFQPKGESCPEVFGVGAIKPNTALGGGNNVTSFTKPDGSIACIKAKGESFAVTPATGTSCA